MKAVKLLNGDWYVISNKVDIGLDFPVCDFKSLKNKAYSVLDLCNVSCPKNWAGRKVRIKIEFVEGDTVE